MTMKRRAIGLISYIKFAYFLCKGVFGNDSPDTVLKVLCKFISLEAPFYSQRIVKSRGINQSITLFKSLIDLYIESKSETILDQALTVLKEDFLMRERKSYGRK